MAGDIPASLRRGISLDKMTVEVQEAAIVNDILHVLRGSEGRYIRFETRRSSSLQNYKLASGLFPAFREITNTLTLSATNFHFIRGFIHTRSKTEFGSINHAFCASLSRILHEYTEAIAILELAYNTDPDFSLRNLYSRLLPNSTTLAHIFSLCQRICKEDLQESADDSDELEKLLEPVMGPTSRFAKGAVILRILTDKIAHLRGNEHARKLFTHLLTCTSRPYMDMLNQWLHRGDLWDPYDEFIIREQQTINKDRLDEDYTDEYWDKRYTIRADDIPTQLVGVADKVLLAGKYLNVVRECGGDCKRPSNEPVTWPESFQDEKFLENIHSAYAHANRTLLELLVSRHDLVGRLQSLKYYLLLDRSDYLLHFLDVAAHELRKPVRAVSTTKLQSLLDLVLSHPGSIAAVEPFKEDVVVQMNEIGLTDWLMRIFSVVDDTAEDKEHESEEGEKERVTGIDALQLDYKIPFPLSLVISRKTVLRYQLLFRHLLQLKHVESMLSSAWIDHAKTLSWHARSSFPRLEMWKHRVWTLRARMLSSIQELMYYCTSEVIEPNFLKLLGKFERGIATVDEVMQNHVDFLDTCLKECMLTNSSLLKV